jgi:hypothetical protein
MNVSGDRIASGIVALIYPLTVVVYSLRIIKKYPGDRGIRFGSVTLILFLCTLEAFRLPKFREIFDWILPVFVFPILILICVTLFYLVRDTIMDLRQSRTRHGAKGKR